MTTLHGFLEDSARDYPQRIAVEDSAARCITYAELERSASRCCELLQKHGVGEDDRVGLYAPKSIAVVIAIFGILKAGAAYVPVDPDSPPERNVYTLEDCGVGAVFLAPGFRQRLPVTFRDRLERIAEWETADLSLFTVRKPGREAPQAKSLGYILYTSGSSGEPKGVMVSHTNAVSFIDWCSETFVPRYQDRFSSHAPFHFDLSIFDLFLAIRHGATVVLIDDKSGKNPLLLANEICRKELSVWYSTPSILRMLVQYGKLEKYDFSTLRLVCFAGEVFPIDYLRALKAVWRHPRYFNLYGPTETNVCTFFEVPKRIPPERIDPFPIGRECSHVHSILVTPDGQATRAEGELCIAGASVMQGYWNLPDRTAQAFITNKTGERWYRTGDLVKKEQGDYIYLGRLDRMVKRRGYRVELGEIEATLYRHPAVTEAATIAAEGRNGTTIKAFVTLAAGEKASVIAMKRFCAENLPAYMVPDYFGFLPSVPKTTTGKTDYQALRVLE